MFDFYDGGGLDLTCVGLAQTDQEGNVNVSRIGPKLIGCGGFINITQMCQECIFCGEFTAGGLDAGVDNGKLVIRQEGKLRKFVEAVEQVTFSGKYARKVGQNVLFVTERCVFKLVPEGLLLTEIAPGIDVQSQVLDNMGFTPIVPDEVAPMNPAVFQEAPMGLK
jgi:propionate CoA-transferase